MFAYHMRLGWRSLRQSPVLTALVVGLIALGVGISMTTLTIYYMMGSDPIPQKSDVLFNVQIDSWEEEEPWDDDRPEAAPYQLGYIDAMGIRGLPGAKHRAAMFKAVYTVQPDNPEINPYVEVVRMTDGDFFAMFDVPFLYGGAWSPDVDSTAERVVVLSKESNEKLFGGRNSVGERLQMGGEYFQVLGVLDEWNPIPNYYDLNNGHFDDAQPFYMPFTMLQFGQLDRSGNTNCWGDDRVNNWEEFLNSKCVWIQYWVEVERRGDIDVYQRHLDDYVRGQKELGRLERPLNNTLMNVNQWLDHNEVVSEDNKVLVGLSFLFLAVCLFNAVGILLARFIGKAPTVGVRRALGASKGTIFRQHLIEVGLIGLLGGLLGLGLSMLGLLGVKQLYRGYEHLVHLDFTLVAIAIGIAIVSALLAGLYPTWRVCQTAPASYLKTQ